VLDKDENRLNTPGGMPPIRLIAPFARPEFGITKTNPTDPAYLDKLRQAFAERGLTDIEIRLISVEAP